MKVVMIYSGKGGVGKTTTTSLIAKILAKNGNKVSIIDGDVATPSIHKMFPQAEIQYGDGEIRSFSLGYEVDSVMFLKNSMIKKFLKDSVRKAQAKKYSPDYILIDTPPSMTDTHNVLMSSFNISGVLMVTQPTELSVTDVKKTMSVFLTRNIPTIGLIQNMIDEKFGSVIDSDKELNLKTLAEIPLDRKMQDLNEETIEHFSYLIEYLERLNDSSIEALLKSNKINFSSEGLKSPEELEKYLEEGFNDVPYEYRKFTTPELWDVVKHRVVSTPILNHQKDPVLQADAKDYEKMFEHFDGETTAMVQIIRPPMTDIPCVLCEIGEGTLFFNHKYFGIPMIKYKTNLGDINLYMHEVKPAEVQDIKMMEEEGAMQSPDGRLLPNLPTVLYMSKLFETLTGIDEKETQDKYYRVMQTNPDYAYLAAIKLKSLADECIRDKDEDSYEQIEEFNVIINLLEDKNGRLDTKVNYALLEGFLNKYENSETAYFKNIPRLLENIDWSKR